MTRTEHLLCILGEECNEIGQRISKALRFGLNEVQTGQDKDNVERIMGEVDDFLGVLSMLVSEKTLRSPSLKAGIMKIEKVEDYLIYSKECGTLDA